ncbi:hypothetical protein BLNAU_19395 [Blattamonas nauphoetae]|uniref:Uncharacterized protein n=1 Tax=Blattamonas nauphoetae TaxID=2049346 RepID=A0ABQ9X1K1_9EUKA|nr:hypothetical protein BLNAU_19395 [Blattamonas nauphoetae]
MLDLPSTETAELCLNPDWMNPSMTELWLNIFRCLLTRASEETQFSDLGTLAVALFMSKRPYQLELFFYSDTKFGLKMNDKNVSSINMDAKTLWTLFTPTQPHHAAIILTAFQRFMSLQNSVIVEKQIWSGWFPSFVRTVDPSKLSFIDDFIALHEKLIEMMQTHLNVSQRFYRGTMLEESDQLREELDETYRAFYTHTKDYVVHLSLHPFALDNINSDVILEFLRNSYLWDFDNSLNKPYRDDVRKAMNEVALSSSDPPFILTSELVCRLTDDEIIDVIDRIVALLKSDSCLDDDTILRICAFHKHQLSRIHLPDLFGKAGRSTEQYLHAFECLLSLPIDYFDRAPINYLLTTRRVRQPTFDEWDDVDFERVGIVKRLISQNNLPIASNSKEKYKCLLNLVIRNQPQIRHLCAARLCQTQLDRLLAPSVDVLCQFLIHPPDSVFREHEERVKLFVGVCKLCDQRVIAQGFSRTGFFSHFVTGLLDADYKAGEFSGI